MNLRKTETKTGANTASTKVTAKTATKAALKTSAETKKDDPPAPKAPATGFDRAGNYVYSSGHSFGVETSKQG